MRDFDVDALCVVWLIMMRAFCSDARIPVRLMSPLLDELFSVDWAAEMLDETPLSGPVTESIALVRRLVAVVYVSCCVERAEASAVVSVPAAIASSNACAVCRIEFCA